ncbi:sensor histidine kinase [Thermosipho sp. 1070]|uniref:sensor histidine kinase n=1 Tax=Thermosipho sp. 1070 TaxID=1437364 RepID=UPI000B4AE409|nr:HAMP domain-containing sensor histidine kinase [Thermosipho sp. 1070]
MVNKKSLTFLVVLITVITIFLYFSFWKNQINEKLKIYTKSIEYPLWLLDNEELERTLKLITNDSEILGVEIFNFNGNKLIKKIKNLPVIYRNYSFPIYFENIFIGNVIFYVSYKKVIFTSAYLIFISALFYIIALLLLKNVNINEKLFETNEELLETNEELEENLKELERTQQSLVTSEKMAAIGKLMVSIAHDINTPIGIIYSAATEIENRINDDDLKELVKIIIKNSQKISNLIKSLKKTTFYEITNEKSKINIKEFVDDIITTISPKLKEKNIKIIKDIDDVSVYSNPGAISQILINLIDNAIFHAFDKKNNNIITISAHIISSKKLEITIKDNGKGIDEKIQRKIFEPFYSTKEKGSGLGLSIVYHLVTEILKGVINVESKKCKGTIFKIIIPVEVK